MRNFDIIHRVERGDTLAKIAARYGVPINMIARDNELTEEIYEGQRLIIGRVDGTVYTVKPRTPSRRLREGSAWIRMLF